MECPFPRKGKYMPESVIVDDGGSTRIRWIKDGVHGNLDGLLRVVELEPGRKGSKHSIRASFTRVVIVVHDQQGIPHTTVQSVSNYVEVTSRLNQNVRMEKLSGRRFRITTYSAVVEPRVEKKQSLDEIVYLVTNAGKITTVTVDKKVIYSITKTGDSVTPKKRDKPLQLTSVSVI
jgi:hypothetical protein